MNTHTPHLPSLTSSALPSTLARALPVDAGKGIPVPIEVTLRPAQRGLGGAPGEGEDDEGGGHHHNHHAKKRKRGGERSRRKRHAAEQRAGKEAKRDAAGRDEAEHGAPGLFGFINGALGDRSEAATKIRVRPAPLRCSSDP